MGIRNDGSITLLNGEATAIEPYRRVMLDGSSPTEVVYADASDGDSWIGVTAAQEGAKPAAGEQVTVILRAEDKAIQVEGADAIANGATLYPSDDGKVTDTAGSTAIGTAIGTTTAAGGITHILPNGGTGAVPSAETIANADASELWGVPIILRKTCTADGDNDQIEVPKPDRKLIVTDAYLIARDTTAANVKLQKGSTDITTAVAKGTVDNTRVQITVFNDANTTLLSTDTLNCHISADTAEVEIYVVCLPIA